MGAKQKRLDSFFTRNVVRRGEEQTTTNMDNQASSKDKNPSSSKSRNVHDAFTINGFKNWNKVKGKYCSFLKHVVDGPNSQHNIAVRFCDTLMNQSGHIDKVMQKQSADQIEKNRRRLQEIDSRFNERVVEILELSAGFNPKEGYKHFNSDSICKLARKYYFLDFTEQEIDVLKFQLKHFEAYVKGHPDLGKLSSIAEVCQGLAETGKASHYYLVDRLIRLVLTLPVSTATIERAFSAMKIVKNRLRNKMDDDFLADNLVLYIEKDIAKIFSLDSILDDFNDVKERRVQLK
ncbi:hypothetical protein LXL04_001332 [Taraxacum kok-saghyz]